MEWRLGAGVRREPEREGAEETAGGGAVVLKRWSTKAVSLAKRIVIFPAYVNFSNFKNM